MLIKQIRSYYENKEHYPCPLTEKLIKAGYQQSNDKDGYIFFAEEQGVEIDYRKGEPNQWWHLIKSYCDFKNDDDLREINLKCGELIFWMAEVSNSVDKSKLEQLVNDIIASGTPTHPRNPKKPNAVYDRRVWNKEIYGLCYENIKKTVEESYQANNV
ncbi:MAG: hypothetical protein KC455_11860 [Carnobacterium sp.]|nr:hypothetical protein [Carnobacterium sp.]